MFIYFVEHLLIFLFPGLKPFDIGIVIYYITLFEKATLLFSFMNLLLSFFEFLFISNTLSKIFSFHSPNIVFINFLWTVEIYGVSSAILFISHDIFFDATIFVTTLFKYLNLYTKIFRRKNIQENNFKDCINPEYFNKFLVKF